MGANGTVHATIKNACRIFVSNQNEEIIWDTRIHIEVIVKQFFFFLKIGH